MIASSILWIVFGILYIVYRISKESHDNNGLYGFIAVFIVGVSFASVYILALVGLGWLIASFLLIVAAMTIKISCISKINSVQEDEYKNSTYYPINKFQQDAIDANNYRIRMNKKIYIDNNNFATKLCDTLIPIAWAIAPIFYAFTHNITPYNLFEFILCHVPFTLVTLYFKILRQK